MQQYTIGPRVVLFILYYCCCYYFIDVLPYSLPSFSNPYPLQALPPNSASYRVQIFPLSSEYTLILLKLDLYKDRLSRPSNSCKGFQWCIP